MGHVRNEECGNARNPSVKVKNHADGVDTGPKVHLTSHKVSSNLSQFPFFLFEYVNERVFTVQKYVRN